MMITLDFCRTKASYIIKDGGAAWLAGSMILAGGKIWSHIRGNNESVSGLLGYFGTTKFRRQITVGYIVCSLSQMFFLEMIKQNVLGLKECKSPKKDIYMISATTASILAGIGSALFLSRSASNTLFKIGCIYGIVELALYSGLFSSKSSTRCFNNL
jgi:hypothetical protein